MKDMGTDVILTGDKFKAYVGELRTKSNIYKQRRAELNDLKAEFGILSRYNLSKMFQNLKIFFKKLQNFGNFEERRIFSC